MQSNADSLEQEDSPQRREATSCFMQARSALKNGETNTAEKLLRRAITLWPDNYNYVLQLAKLAIQVSRSEGEVEELLQRSSNLNLTATEPRLLLATQYEKVGELKKAVSIYRGVLNIDPNNLIVRRRLSQLNIDLSLGMSMNSFVSHFGVQASAPPEPEEEAVYSQPPDTELPEPPLAAEPAYAAEPEEPEAEPAMEPEVENVTTPVARPALTLGQGSLEEVISESEQGWDTLMKTIQHNSQSMEINGDMHLNVGLSYIGLGLHEEAIEELHEAWRLFVRDGDEEALRCCRLLIDCTCAVGHYKDASEWCERGLEMAGRDSEEGLAFIDELVGIYEKLGERKRAAQLREELNSLSPGYGNMATMSLQADPIGAAARFALRPVRGISGEEFVFDGSQQEIAIGRSENNDIIIESQRVSKEHARLRFAHKGLFITSLSKTNGTYLNDEKLELGREYRMQIGDRIGLGKTIDLELVEYNN